MSERIVRITIRGRVQSVGFRAFIEQQAELNGLTGFVRNRLDGSIEAIVAGDSYSIDKLVAACRRGPAHAAVSSCRVEEADEAALREEGDRLVFRVAHTK